MKMATAKQYTVYYQSNSSQAKAYNCILCGNPIISNSYRDKKWCRIAHLECAHYRLYPSKNGTRHKCRYKK